MDDLNEKIDRALIKIAELKVKGLPLEDVLKRLVEDKDLYGLLVLGIILGYTGSHTQLVYAIWHNLNAAVARLKRGESPEELLKELKRVRKEYREYDFLVYGG